MKKKYNPKEIEESIYRMWKENGYFKPNNNIKKKSFCIIMPPPNITGILHMGHAFQHTIMDILIRYHRMQGDNTLWQIGFDHAGIATQMVVSKHIKLKHNINLNSFGRKNFIKKCWEWKNISINQINYQMQRLGNSVDWSRERFTLDPISSRGVKKVFIDLYNHNLIYRKKKLSNWDTKLRTVISDLELDYQVVKGNVWYIRYPILDYVNNSNIQKYLTVATTRPETLLGDTAVAVNPIDKRYISLIGKYVQVPLVNRIIPIISDQYVDMNKGTGCVKITPAHDFNDYEIALRHHLPLINIFQKDGNICEYFNVYDILGYDSNIYDNFIPIELRGLNKFLARNKLIDMLKELNLLENVFEENITLPYGDRSHSIIEPMLTNQWYLKISDLSQPAISAVLKNDIKFFPKKYQNMYFSWMNNIQDWCISRQLWWGHRIPAWYDIRGRIYVGKNEKDIRKKYFIPDNEELLQDEDVLDTWFSSSLWTFISLDWPKKNNLLNTFHPTNVIVTGFDIIFFWIARMIIMTMYCIKDNQNISHIPFKSVYITGLIRDENGKKMSKSEGNVLDPLDIIDGINLSDLLKKRTKFIIDKSKLKEISENTKKQFPSGISSFGSDALRFTFSSLSSPTRSINWDMNRLQGYKKFCNKIWNAGRFILIYFQNINIDMKYFRKILYFFDHWILLELNNVIKIYRDSLDIYRFDIAANELYNFVWHKFCDWYLEIIKIIVEVGSIQQVQNAQYTLFYVFESILRLSHPIIPFITEKIWKDIKHIMNISESTIMLQPFPIFNKKILNNSILKMMYFIQDMILFIRNTRVNFKIHSKKLLSIFISNLHINLQNIFLYYKNIIKKLAYLENITILFNENVSIPDTILGIIDNVKIFIIVVKDIDHSLELKKIKKKINILSTKINLLKELINNQEFIKKAPNKIILQKKENLNELITTYNKLIFQKNNILSV
ncbi:valine--tRNA ligase [Buchnera aphidicola]|uniref:valine--tRNA ligase n=1 Tax=Buchnera aphidicola TaxID=9 RepID=UPI003464A0D1